MTISPQGRRHWRAVVMTACLALAAPALHADEDKRAAQLREAARRSQAAAQAAQQELAGVKAERDRLAQAEATRQQALDAAQAQGRQRGAELSRLRAAVAQAEAERDRLQAELRSEATARETLQRQLDAAQAQGQAGAQALDEQRRVTQAVSALLARSVKALGAAEEANRQLHALGLKAVEAYTERTPEANWARGEPFFGLATVRLENEAETLRRLMDAQKVAP